MNDVPESNPPLPSRTASRTWFRRTGLAIALVASGAALPMVVASAQGTAMQMHGMMHGGGDMHAMAMSHITQMLDEVGASDDQKAKIGSILRAGFEPIAGLHKDMANTHATLHKLLSAPTVDRAAIEQLRAAEIARLDSASRVATAAMADAADVLRPDQRAKLANVAAAHGPGM